MTKRDLQKNVLAACFAALISSSVPAQAAPLKFERPGVLNSHTNGYSFGVLYLLSDDGAVASGYSTNSDGASNWLEGVVWDHTQGLTSLSTLGIHSDGNRFSSAERISANGAVVAGFSSNSNGLQNWQEAFVWTKRDGMQGLGVLGVYANPFQNGYRFSSVSALSADGKVIVGQSSNTDGLNDWLEAFRWTKPEGMQGLGVLGVHTSGSRFSTGYQVSAKGDVVIGVSSNTDGVNDWSEAFRWTASAGMAGLGVLGRHTDGFRYSVVGQTGQMSESGTVVAGTSSNSDGFMNWDEAFVWTEETGIRGLGVLGVSTASSYKYSTPGAVSRDGRVVAGNSSNSDGLNQWNEAFRWTEKDGMSGLGVLGVHTDGTRGSDFYAMSRDGKVVAGRSTNSDGIHDWWEAYRWTNGRGLQGLGVLGVHTDGVRGSEFSAMSANGKVIAGISTNSDGTNNWWEAFRWTEATGIQSLADWIGSSVNLQGARFDAVTVVSSDGRTLIGLMTNDNGLTHEPFWARVGGLLTPKEFSKSLLRIAAKDEERLAIAALAIDEIAGLAKVDGCSQLAADQTCSSPMNEENLQFHTSRSGDISTRVFSLNAEVAPGLLAGLGANWNVTESEGIDAQPLQKKRGMKAGAFLQYTPSSKNIELEAVVIGSMSEEPGVRTSMNGLGWSTSAADLFSETVSARMRGSWNIYVEEQLSLSPYVSATVLAIHTEEYSEQGGAFPAQFDERLTTSVLASTGLEVRSELTDDLNVMLRGAWVRRMEHSNSGVSGELVGIGEFEIEGRSVGRDWFEGALTIAYVPTEAISLSADFGVSNDYFANNQIAARIVVGLRFD